MAKNVFEDVRSAIAKFRSETRLYGLTIGDDDNRLLVEAFSSHDELGEVGMLDVIALSVNAIIDPDSLLGQPASLRITLANGSRTTLTRDISEVTLLECGDGLARYRLRLQPWLWRLAHVRNSRIWQDKSVIDIIDAVFAAYLPRAQWRWSDETPAFMNPISVRSHCCQYRESDLAFVQRLLRDEGLSWRCEQADDGACIVLFADSSKLCAVPEDESSAASAGIRYHAAQFSEEQDTVQFLHVGLKLVTSHVTLLSYDYKAKKAVAANSRSLIKRARSLPPLESYDVPGAHAFADARQAQHYADIQMQELETRAQPCGGRSTVRTLRAGTRLSIRDIPWENAPPSYTVLSVFSVGVNNLPTPARDGLAELFGPVPQLLDELLVGRLPPEGEITLDQAISHGYANSFEAVPSTVVWRPDTTKNKGRTSKATALGSQSAIVVGPDGAATPSGSNELYCDRLGRVRIRFHWQDDRDAAFWVRVGQRFAGNRIGSQFVPRIGQEVVVQFIENNIDRPVIVSTLYNGQGEGGIAPTPGGKQVASKTDVFSKSHDHAVSAQGNIAGGNSPVWHGASANSAGHRNAAALWGIRSKEFGGPGYNQLVFDDTDEQTRVQLRSTYAASELNMGHLIHCADNYRGSLRGHGAELRTDAYGAIRAGAGILVSSYRIAHTAQSRDPAGDNTAGIALMKQAVKLGETFNAAAATHLTVKLASHVGAAKAGGSLLDHSSAPLKAMLNSLSGMVSQESLQAAEQDAASRNTGLGERKLPHSADPLIAISAKAGLGVTAGQSIQWANGETATLMTGGDMQFVSGGTLRVHSGQAIGVLGGAVKPGAQNIGLQVIAAKEAIDIQAQSDEFKAQARDEVDIISTNGHIDWAAAKTISLSTAGGANITISGGNITFQCPGKITVRAGKKSFDGPANHGYVMPKLPNAPITSVPAQFDMRLQDAPGPNGVALPHIGWRIVNARDMDAALMSSDVVLSGTSDTDGRVTLSDAQQQQLREQYNEHPNNLWIIYDSHVRKIEIAKYDENWNQTQQQFHAMDALGYSDNYDTVGDISAADFHAALARSEFKLRTVAGLLKKIRK